MKFVKLLFFLLFLLILAAAWGYYQGLRLSDVKPYVSDLIAKLTRQPNQTPEDPSSIPTLSEPAPAKKKTTSKKDAIELQPLPKNLFEKIDKHARNSPNTVEKDIESIAAYLQQVATSDLEKARAIYVWLTDNINYDDDGYNTGNYGDLTPTAVLKSRKAVCDGFSNLFLALGKQMGLEIEKVSGYAKGYGYEEGMKFQETDHAWNIIKIDGEWRIFDATWGQGNGKNVEGKLVSKKEFDNYWFNVNPYEAIFNHLPENIVNSHVNPYMDLGTYEELPKIDKAYFQIGFSGEETYKSVLYKRTLNFPACYNIRTHVKVTSAPRYEVLYTNLPYKFEFYIPRGQSVAIIDSQNEWTYFEMEKGVFKLRYVPVLEGELKVSVLFDKGGSTYHTIMIYKVKGPELAS